MENILIGYVRVSTKDQCEDRQIFAMRKFGVPDENIFVEKMSGKSFNRPLYQGLLKKIKPGDTLVIKSIDRLGRDYEEIIEQWRYITKTLDANIVVIDLPLLDTRQKERDLTGAFVAGLVLQILSYVAETERLFNLQRQAEGIAAAKAKGAKFGRKPKKRPADFNEVFSLWKSEKTSARESARKLGISHTTFKRWCEEITE
jgi:DNA invertase Pin-like site-specific DNA recombinase